jgi:hypothetical protein
MDEPSNEWEFEVIRRVRAGEDEETALAAVIALYLDAADPRALVGAIEKGHAIPALIRWHIVSIFEKEPTSNEPVPVILEIEPPRREGIIADGLRDFFWAAYDALVEGRDPGQVFWRMLALWLRAGHPEHWTGDPLDVPVKVRLRFREKRRGRPPKAERSTNQAVLAELMARERARGTQYKSAAFKVRAEIERQACAENWEGELPSEETIAAAYKLRSK